MSAMTKKEWMEYLEKTWDAAQKEAWSEPQFECPRCGHCCQAKLETEQEPVAWMHNFIEGNVITHIPADIGRHPERWTPLYTTPLKKQWVGLTLKEILINRHLIDWTSEWSYVEFAREIERALKEKNHG